jgi:integrator complex subunit 1
LLNKDDYLRSLRALLKEINRVLRHDFNLLSIVHSLLRERKEFANSVRESEFRERVFFSSADLVCMCMLLCVTPQVRDASSQNKRDVTVLKAFQKQVSNIQREAVTWLNDSALRVFRPNVNDFHHVLLKVLFLEQAEHYYKVDSWPGENERNLFLRLASEIPLLQATLLRILLIGNSKEHPISPTEAIEISDQLIRRAANLPQDCAPPLAIDNIEIIGIYFSLCSYNYPENITLPTGYVPPSLAISGLYWKVWLILLILAAHNPMTFGNEVWNKYPTLRMFMEMCITNHFSFPPPTMASLDEDYQSREQQILALEKQKNPRVRIAPGGGQHQNGDNRAEQSPVAPTDGIAPGR